MKKTVSSIVTQRRLAAWKTELNQVRSKPHTVIVSQKKLDPFSFEHNFIKYCPIIIILSLLQTVTKRTLKSTTIHTSNLLVHYLVKSTMHWLSLLA